RSRSDSPWRLSSGGAQKIDRRTRRQAERLITSPVPLLTLFFIYLALAPQLCHFPVDITMEEAYLLWYVQRTACRYAEIGSPPGNARPDGLESSRRARAAARLWHRPPDRAG